MKSDTLTIPLCMLLAFSSSASAPNPADSMVPHCIESPYQTTSLNTVAKEFRILNLKAAAMDLFGVQSNFSSVEQETYANMLERNSVKVGINISDYFK